MAYQVPEFKTAKITSVNTRSERHGSETLVPAVDVGIMQSVPNTVLDEFAPGLLQTLYSKAQADDGGQGTLDGVDVASDYPVLRFPQMAPLKWARIQQGDTFTIEQGLGGASNIVLTGCKVTGFVLTPKEGGTVELKYKVQCSEDLDERTLGKLALLVQHEVPIMLEPAKVDGQKELIENPLPFGPDKSDPENPFTPEDAFAQAAMGKVWIRGFEDEKHDSIDEALKASNEEVPLDVGEEVDIETESGLLIVVRITGIDDAGNVSHEIVTEQPLEDAPE